MSKTDIAIIGGGINGASTALELAKNGLKVTLLDKHSICKGASGVNAGTLTMHMTRAQLIPCLLYTSPSPRDKSSSRMPSSA